MTRNNITCCDVMFLGSAFSPAAGATILNTYETDRAYAILGINLSSSIYWIPTDISNVLMIGLVYGQTGSTGDPAALLTNLTNNCVCSHLYPSDISGNPMYGQQTTPIIFSEEDGIKVPASTPIALVAMTSNITVSAVINAVLYTYLVK